MNELFILGELMEGPQSGYDLHNALKVSLGRHRKISYGVIYPLLEKLEERNFLEITTIDRPDGKIKKLLQSQKKERNVFLN